MDQKIYILKNRTRIKGPFSLEALPKKLHSGSDLIWYKGLADWTQASLIENFKEFAKSNSTTKAKIPFWKRVSNSLYILTPIFLYLFF